MTRTCWMPLILLVLLPVMAPAAAPAPAPTQDDPRAVVGMPHWFRDLVLPGPRLEVATVELETPLILRIADVSPHGDAFRYDLEVYGLDPGRYDVADYLAREDGSAVRIDGFPALPMTIDSVLPAGRVQPNRPRVADPPAVGGYGTLLWVAGAAWVLGLWALLAAGRRRRAEAPPEEAPPLTVADRLRPLVDHAIAGTLSDAQRAELERTLIAFWRTRKGLGQASAADALMTLRNDSEAGPLLRQVEEWLHHPEPPKTPVDLSELLTPYREPMQAGAGTERAV